MATTRWAVLGSCGIAKRRTIPEGILPAENAELVAVYDLDEEANQAYAAELGVHAVNSESMLLASHADVVYIATPAHLHYAQVLDALKTGKHVFCEKPLALTVAQAAEITAEQRAHGVRLGLGFMMRHHACHQEALRMIQTGKLGRLVLGRAQLSCWYPHQPGAWRQDPKRGGGGSLMDLGGHCIDLLEMFFGKVRRVSCFAAHLVHAYASEDSATVLLEFEGGAHAVVDAFFNIPDAASRNRLELYGAKGSVLAEGTIGQTSAGSLTAYLEEAAAEYDAGQQRADDGGITIAPEPVNMYQAEVEAFSAAVQAEEDNVFTGANGLWSQKVLAACYESAHRGVAIAIDDDKDDDNYEAPD